MEWSTYQLNIFDVVDQGSGHVIVIARAGSAKTTTAIELINYVQPRSTVLMTAFNKLIADELGRRVRLTQARAEVATLHKLGLRTVSKRWPNVEIDDRRMDKWIKVLLGDNTTVGNADDFLEGRNVAYEGESRERRAHTVVAHTRSALRDLVRFSKNSLASTPDDSADLASEFDCVGAPYSALELGHMAQWIMDQSVKHDGKVDFDDMIWLPAALGWIPTQYDVVVCDEMQDLSSAQLWLAKAAVRKPNGRLIGLLDDRQAIYGWRGARSDEVLAAFKELNATKLSLPISYRCPKRIVEIAQKFVPDFQPGPNAIDGEVTTDLVEEDLIAGARPGDFVISRTNAPLVSACLELARVGKPAFIRGNDIGNTLAALVRRSKARTVPELHAWLDAYLDTELRKKRLSPQVADRVYTIKDISKGCFLAREVAARIESIFDDAGTDGVVLTSTHKVKGLEADRVWLLGSTYVRQWREEEHNIWYVAVTRCKRELFVVGRLAADTEAAVEQRYYNSQMDVRDAECVCDCHLKRAVWGCLAFCTSCVRRSW